jgi:hypothetical protein
MFEIEHYYTGKQEIKGSNSMFSLTVTNYWQIKVLG